MTMAGFKNKLGLGLDSTPKTLKKYLGEADDPHFIPDSPIIQRQHFTDEEEEELKWYCALALMKIPHSDDMSGDPFKYITSQVIHHDPAPKPTGQSKPTIMALPRSIQPKSQSSPQVKPIPNLVETATPSESSKRDTFDRTDYSTPLTSAGMTPGETTKRFSDAAQRPSTSKGSSNLKYDSSQTTKDLATPSSRVVANKPAEAGPRKKHDRKPSKEKTPSRDKPLSKDKPSARQHTIKLVQQTPRPSQVHAHSADNVKPNRFSQLELNKKLPPLPRAKTDPVEKPSIGRLIKTIKRKKPQTIDGRSVSASATPSPMQPAISKFNSNSIRPLSHAPSPPHTAGDPKQRRFKFNNFFTVRKESPATILAS